MSQTQSIVVSNQDLPALFQSADRASTDAQRGFVRCMAIDLVLIVSSAVVGAFSSSSETAKAAFAFLSAGLMAAGLLLTIYIRNQRFEQDWYDGRAVAESVKTRVWRFMTCSEPYLEGLGEDKVSSLFLQTIKELMNERKRFSASLGTETSLDPQITQKMLAIRLLPLLERKSIYLSQRINDQRKWYSSKARINKQAANLWFNAIMLAQLLALLSSLALIQFPDLPINLASIFAAAAAAFIAWGQLKRHQELSNSYGLASQELGLIAEQAQHVNDPGKLSTFVLDAENAISREHTLWIARRDNY